MLTAWMRWIRKAALSFGSPITVVLSLLAVLLTMLPATASICEFAREGLRQRQWWRVVSGHLTHWNADHAAWDLAMFAVLGMVCERTSRRRFVVTLAASMLGISAGLWWLLPDLRAYRGLSGVDSALFGLLAATIVRDGRAATDRATLALGVGMLAAFALKLDYELITGQTMFVDADRAGFVPIPLSHAIGAAIGTLVGIVPNWARHPGALLLSPMKASRRGQLLPRNAWPLVEHG